MNILFRLLLLVAAIATSALAVEITAPQCQFTVEAPWEDQHGYTPIVITIDAKADIAGEITVESVGDKSAKMRVEAPAGSRQRRTLMLPGGRSSSSYATFTWIDQNGDKVTEAFSCANGHGTFDLVLIDPFSEVATAPMENFLATRVNIQDLDYGGRSVWNTNRLKRMNVGMLPDRWQAYPRWICLILTQRAEATLSSEQRQALAAWWRSGGTLMVLSPEQLPAWRKLGVEPRQVDLKSQPDWTWIGEQLTAINGESNGVPKRMSVPGTEKVPVGGFVTLAALFALVVGPLNLWWVRRRNQRHLFLITTPALSLATCVALLIFNIFVEGVSLRRVSRQVAFLDNRTQQAVVWHRLTYFAAFTVSAIPLEQDMKLVSMDPNEYEHSYRYYGRGYRDELEHQLGLDWRDGQLATGAWIPARVNCQLMIVDAKPQEQRLILSRDGGGWRVTNGLGVDVVQLQWRDAANKVWSCGEIAAGADGLLAPGASVVPIAPPKEEEVVYGLNRLMQRTASVPLGFSAELSGNFVAPGGPTSEDLAGNHALVFGYLEPGRTGAEKP